MKIPAATLSFICQSFNQLSFPASEVIFQEGTTGNLMYVVVEGELHVSLHGNYLDSLTAGDIFGEMALVSNAPRSGTVTAVTDSLLIPITGPQFNTLIAEHSEFGRHVMSVMARRLQHWMEEEVRRQRLEQELAIGRRIQLSLLPAKTPHIPGWQFASFYRAARQVGGDFYDFITSADNPDQLSIVIADVSGKGVPAALFMAVARTMIRAESRTGRSPAEILKRTNELIISDNRSPLFLSALHAVLNTRTGHLAFASAGHEMPLLIHQETASIEEPAAAGLVLGAFSSISYQEQNVTLKNGDIAIFYTDGLTESRDENSDFFGEDHLLKTLEKILDLTASEIADRIVDSLAQFTGTAPQADDLTILVIKRNNSWE